jgi:hypothetical protein
MEARIKNALAALLMPVFMWAMTGPASAANYTVEYEMDASPDAAGGFYNPTGAFDIGALVAGSYGSNSTFANGIMHYINSGDNGPRGYYWHPRANPCPGETFVCTVDMMVKANVHTGATSPVSLNWCQGGNSGWSMQLNPLSVALNSFGTNPLNCVQQTPPATDLTSFRRIRVVLAQGDLISNPDYATIGVYDLDTGATIYSPCTGNGGPAPGDDPYVGSDQCATIEGSTCGIGRDRNGNLSCTNNTSQQCCPGGTNCDPSAAYNDCNPVVPVDGIAKGGFTIGTFTGSRTARTDFEVEYFRVLMYTAMDNATTQIHRAPLTSGCTSVSPNVAVSTSALYSTESGSPPTLVLHSKGTASGVGNLYWYPDIAHPSYTIASGDHFVYDIYTKNPGGTPSGSVDIEMSGGALRDSGILDQNGRSGHPGTDLSSVALNQWYHRDFDLSARAGDTIGAFEMGHEIDSGTSEFYACNVQIINGSTLKLVGYDQNTWSPVSDTVGPTNNGYGSLTVPEMVAPLSTPPAPPLSPVTTLSYVMTNYSTSSARGYSVVADSVPSGWLTVSPASGSIPADNANDPTNTHNTATITATVNSSSLAPGDYVGHLTFTDGGCTAAAVRTVNLTVIGCAMQVQQPNVRFAVPCAATPAQASFTMQNTGASTWTTFSAAQVNTSVGWLQGFTYDPPQGTEIPAGGTVTATANIDWSQNPTPGDGADIRFRASCDGVNNIDVTPTAQADAYGGPYHTLNISSVFDVLYQGDVSPSSADSATSGYKFELVQGAEQGTASASDPSDASPTDSRYYLLNDAAGGPSTQWRLITDGVDHPPVIDSLGATVVARMKSTAYSQGSTNSYFNEIIMHNRIAAAVCWNQSNAQMREELSGQQTAIPNDGKYHVVRLTSVKTTGGGNAVNVYVDEQPTPAMSISTTGDIDYTWGGIRGIGFGTASNSGAQTIYYDWVAATNAGAFAPGEEVSCLGHTLGPASPCLPEPFADVDKDGDVDQADFAVLQACYTGVNGGPVPAAPSYCACLDHGDDDQDGNPEADGDIDQFDLTAFENCATGPDIPWSQGATPNCRP